MNAPEIDSRTSPNTVTPRQFVIPIELETKTVIRFRNFHLHREVTAEIYALCLNAQAIVTRASTHVNIEYTTLTQHLCNTWALCCGQVCDSDFQSNRGYFDRRTFSTTCNM